LLSFQRWLGRQLFAENLSFKIFIEV